jgi:hypothetical protein
MFDSLDDQIKADINKESTSTERMIRYGIIAVASVVLFGGLIMGVRVFS